jgi:hypothetical protein
MLINADQTTFKDAKKALNRIGMSFAPDIFLLAMADHIMLSELGAKNPVLPGIVSHKVRFGVNVILEIGLQGLGANAGNMEGTDFAVSLDQRQDRVFVPVALCASWLRAWCL